MKMTEEIDIIWIPEEETKHSLTVENAQGVNELVDLPASTVDRICKKKYSHTNWARMGALYPEDLARNPHEIDYLEGIVYFKNLRMV